MVVVMMVVADCVTMAVGHFLSVAKYVAMALVTRPDED